MAQNKILYSLVQDVKRRGIKPDRKTFAFFCSSDIFAEIGLKSYKGYPVIESKLIEEGTCYFGQFYM